MTRNEPWLDESDVPDKYDTEGQWGFAFTGALARHPETFEIWWAEEGQVFEGGNLDRGFKELLGAVVAHERGAAICIAWHTTSAAIEDVDPERFAVAADFDARKDELPDDKRVGIEFARKSVESPGDVTDADVEKLRARGVLVLSRDRNLRPTAGTRRGRWRSRYCVRPRGYCPDRGGTDRVRREPAMNEERVSTTERGRMTRRGLLALAGTSVLAGCTGLAGLGGGGESTIRAYDLPDIDPEEYPESAVPESIPVDIAPDHFDAARNRVGTLLAELPTPLGPEDIPNGYVRQQLSDAATDATTGLDDARDALTELVALAELRQARAQARYVAAGWGVADRDLSVGPLQREYRQAVSEARSVRDAHEYVGSDPVRAALVHGRIEDTLARVIDSRVPSRDGNQLLYIAEWGEEAESAQAHLDDARHLDEQFAASLPAEVGTIEETLTGAAETLLAGVRSRRSGLPPEPTAEEWGIPERVIGDLRRDADDGVARVTDANGPASAVIDANRRLTQFQALDRLQERIDDGELSRPQSAEAVREIRSTAYDALDAALEGSPAPDLTRTAVTGAAWRVASTDWELARYEGEIAVSRLDTDIADYVIATAVGRVAPDISRQTVETLETV